MAHQQLDQTSEILGLVGKDERAFTDRFDAHSDLREIYGSVGRFLLPA
jgi:hypothetical protein